MAKKEDMGEKSEISQHKRMAMGEKVTGMKTGGKVEAKAKGGMCHKTGGTVKKRGK